MSRLTLFCAGCSAVGAFLSAVDGALWPMALSMAGFALNVDMWEYL